MPPQRLVYRNDDVRRWLKGDWFNTKIKIWNVYGATKEEFYVESELQDMLHVFSSRNYLVNSGQHGMAIANNKYFHTFWRYLLNSDNQNKK